MSFKPIPPIRGMSGAGISIDSGDTDSASVTSNATATSKDIESNLAKKIWCETQWTNLSAQAKRLGLPKLPYFDPKSMLLSKEVNKPLWRQLLRLYTALGAEKAPYATPVMVEGGEVKWYSYVGESKGQEADVFDFDRKWGEKG